MQNYFPTQTRDFRSISQLCDIPAWGVDEILNMIDLVMENDISYLEFVFFIQDKIALNGLAFPDRDVSSICRCLDLLEDVFSRHDNWTAAELSNADLIGEIFNRITRIIVMKP